MSELPEPSFKELLRASLRVCGVALALALAAYGLWRLIAWLFPDVGWLESGD